MEKKSTYEVRVVARHADSGIPKPRVGVIFDEPKKRFFFTHTKYSDVAEDSLSFTAFDWGFKHIVAGLSVGELPDNLEIWHEGHCGKCGRLLHDPISVSVGFGPSAPKCWVS